MMKRFFLLLSLPFSLYAATVCNDCAQQYATVRAYAVTVTNNLDRSHVLIQTCIYRNQSIQTQIQNIRSHYSTTGTVIPVYVESACFNADTYATQSTSDLSILSQQVDTSLSSARSILSTLDNFECSCASNSCGCVSILTDIYDAVCRIENGTVDYINSIHLAVEDLPIYLENIVSTLTSIYYSLMDIRNKIYHPDDDYISDLAYISSQIVQSVNLPPSLAFDLSSSRFPSDTDRNNIELGIGYLYSVDYQNMIINHRSNETLTEILSVISNININVTNKSDNSSQWSVDLAFLSNYLWTVQRGYFARFNASAASLQSTNPFNNNYSLHATMWNTITDPTKTQSEKDRAFRSYLDWSHNTNWFNRIEFALYGLAGAFSTNTVSGTPISASSISNSINRLSPATNFVSGITLVFTDVTNSVDTLAAAFKDFTDSFHFTSQGEFSQSFVVCPSFEFGNLEFSGITFDMYEISDICSIIRSSCRLIWTSLFSFLGLFLGIRFFVELGKAIAHIFVMLKTLL